MRAANWWAMGLLVIAGGCNESHIRSVELMNEGVEAGRQKLYDTAIKKLELSAQTEASNHLAWYNLGAVYKDAKKWDKAAEAFDKAVKLQDGNASYHYELGLAYEEQARELKKADPAKTDITLIPKRIDQARAEYEASVKIDPKLYKVHYRLGNVLEDLDKLREADAEYRKAIDGNPRFVQPYIKLGYLYFDHDYDKEAVQVFQGGVLAADNDGEVHLGLGRALQKSKQYDEAVKEFKKALERNGELFTAVYDLGMTYKMMDDKKNAKEWLQRFIAGSGSKGTGEMMKAAQDAMYQLDAP